ncbi:uncharacterized protein LOC127734138 [Mytilus californianus]|uniref:uncharacterized protein LOC127734138 n=1 Tax=Mytilus californianus TaxID=6549 RepID=UPI00224824FE|nr:uncharacterized protein LOC127734138 [Mytilus californianus]
MSDISGAKDKESVMIIQLRRIFQREPDKMKELQLRLRHHLPSEILQPEREFQDVFDALTLKRKISLGEYSFLCDVFSEIYFEAEKITREYQAIIINLLGQQISEQRHDSLVDKREFNSTLYRKKIDCSKIVGDVVNKYVLEIDEEQKCREIVSNMAQVALQAKKHESGTTVNNKQL